MLLDSLSRGRISCSSPVTKENTSLLEFCFTVVIVASGSVIIGTLPNMSMR